MKNTRAQYIRRKFSITIATAPNARNKARSLIGLCPPTSDDSRIRFADVAQSRVAEMSMPKEAEHQCLLMFGASEPEIRDLVMKACDTVFDNPDDIEVVNPRTGPPLWVTARPRHVHLHTDDVENALWLINLVGVFDDPLSPSERHQLIRQPSHRCNETLKTPTDDKEPIRLPGGNPTVSL